jgi:hypothetical protein
LIAASPESTFRFSALFSRGDAAHDPLIQVFTPNRGSTHLLRTNQNPRKPTSSINGRIDSAMIAAPVIRVGVRLFSGYRKDIPRTVSTKLSTWRISQILTFWQHHSFHELTTLRGGRIPV